MAIVSFPATYQTSWREVANLPNFYLLKGKEGNEVIRSLDAVQVWQDWFAERYGELTELRHRSNPDDPPDIDLVFEKGQAGLELTVLKPHPLGHAEAIAKKVNPAGGRVIPSLSGNHSRDELEKLAIPMLSSAPWANINEEHQLAAAALVSMVRRKMKNPASQVICVWDETTFGDADSEWLASGLHGSVNTEAFGDFGDRTLIFLHRDNQTQFFSALVRRGEPLLAKRDGSPATPRSPLSFR